MNRNNNINPISLLPQVPNLIGTNIKGTMNGNQVNQCVFGKSTINNTNSNALNLNLNNHVQLVNK
jgi:hypothetical protein